MAAFQPSCWEWILLTTLNKICRLLNFISGCYIRKYTFGLVEKPHSCGHTYSSVKCYAYLVSMVFSHRLGANTLVFGYLKLGYLNFPDKSKWICHKIVEVYIMYILTPFISNYCCSFSSRSKNMGLLEFEISRVYCTFHLE